MGTEIRPPAVDTAAYELAEIVEGGFIAAIAGKNRQTADGLKVKLQALSAELLGPGPDSAALRLAVASATHAWLDYWTCELIGAHDPGRTNLTLERRRSWTAPVLASSYDGRADPPADPAARAEVRRSDHAPGPGPRCRAHPRTGPSKLSIATLTEPTPPLPAPAGGPARPAAFVYNPSLPLPPEVGDSLEVLARIRVVRRKRIGVCVELRGRG